MKTVLLMGAGHGHLEIIRALKPKDTQNTRYIMVSPERETYYSGLIPRYVMGQVDAQKIAILSWAYAESKGVRVIQDKVIALNTSLRQVTLAGGEKLSADVISINIGGGTPKFETAAADSTVNIRPFPQFLLKWQEVQKDYAAASASGQQRVLVVIGGGAAAFEIAIALKVRHQQWVVHLVCRGERLCDSYSVKTSALILGAAQDLGIKVYLNENIKQIGVKQILLKDGSSLKFDYVFVAIPGQPLPLEIQSNHVGKDGQGFIQTDQKLQVAPAVFAIGDCASVRGANYPKSGVVAVHQGRHLIKSIQAVLHDQTPPDFVKPRKLLNILVAGEFTAISIWGNYSSRGTWSMKLKNYIDLRYLQTF